MRKLRAAVLGLVLVAFGYWMTPAAKADIMNEKTIVTFSAPIQLTAKVVLPAGTYIFELAGNGTLPDIVQVFDASHTHVYATIMAQDVYRYEPFSNAQVTLAERPANSPEAVGTFWYPGDTYGHELNR